MDREYWDTELGLYYFCVKAYDALSAVVNVVEQLTNGKRGGDFDVVYNFFL